MKLKLVAGATLAAAVVGCGGVAQEPNLAKAVERTEAAGSSRIEIRGLLTEDGEQVAIRCDGAADYADRRLRFTCNRGFGDMIVIGETIYMTTDPFGVEVGKPWLKLPLEEEDTIRNFSPEKILGMLRAASLETKRVDEEDVRGEPTVRYRLTVDCEQADIGCSGSTGPVDVWIDGDGLVRRIQFEDDGDPVTIEFFDFGADVEIDAPPADQVADEDAALGSASGSGRGSGGVSVSPVAPCTEGEAKPISEDQAVAALRRHGFTMSAEACGQLTNAAGNTNDVLAQEGLVYCSVYPKPPADAPKQVVRRGVDGGDAELLLANVQCMILADSPDAEEKIDPLEAAFEDLQRAIRP